MKIRVGGRIAEFQRGGDEREGVEFTLTQERNLYRTLIDHVPDYIYAKNTDGRFIFANVSMARHLGASSSEALIGKSVFDFYSRELAEQIHAGEEPVLKLGRELIRCEEFTKDPAGNPKWICSSKTPLRDEQGNIIGLVGVEQDITADKLAEMKLKTTVKRLEQSNADLEQFAYVTSHDMQEPLRMISLYLALLRKCNKDNLDANSQEYIGYAVDGAQRMHQLFNDFMGYFRVMARGKPFKPTDCEKIFSRVLNNLKGSIHASKPNVMHDPLPTVRADAFQMGQLLQHLVENAIKYRQDKTLEVHVSAERKGEEWVFSVRDNGIGIDPKYHNRIFGLFKRLHARDRYSGTGIGLAVCKKIVERHGGRIWVESEEGKGATFYFSLPVQDGCT